MPRVRVWASWPCPRTPAVTSWHQAACPKYCRSGMRAEQISALLCSEEVDLPHRLSRSRNFSRRNSQAMLHCQIKWGRIHYSLISHGRYKLPAFVQDGLKVKCIRPCQSRRQTALPKPYLNRQSLEEQGTRGVVKRSRSSVNTVYPLSRYSGFGVSVMLS